MIDVEADHSSTLGSARHQGYVRGTCVAFAASDLNAARHGVGHLSVDYLCHYAAKHATDWQPGDGFTVSEILAAVKAPGQPLETVYAYEADITDRPLHPVPAKAAPLYASVARERYLDTKEAIERVRRGNPVGLVVGVSQTLYYPKAGVVDFDPLAIPDLYHALVALGVGKHTQTSETHVLVRNSWGSGWGLNGHAWISERHLDVHLQEAFLI